MEKRERHYLTHGSDHFFDSGVFFKFDLSHPCDLDINGAVHVLAAPNWRALDQ